MSPPHNQTHARGVASDHRAGAVEASRASMRRELARAGLSPDAGRTAQATPTAIGAKASDAQANMRRQLARAGRAPA